MPKTTTVTERKINELRKKIFGAVSVSVPELEKKTGINRNILYRYMEKPNTIPTDRLIIIAKAQEKTITIGGIEL